MASAALIRAFWGHISRFFTFSLLVPSRRRRYLAGAEPRQHSRFPLPPSERGAPIGQAPLVPCPGQPRTGARRRMWHHPVMEITWLGDTCVRLKGREGVVVADAYRTVAGPTGRGLTADICTYSHADGASIATVRPAATGALSTTVLGVIRPTSLESAFTIDSPRANTRCTRSWSPACARSATTRRAASGGRTPRSCTSSTASTRSTLATSATC